MIAGRAPGRLDVLGGVADYSGSLVLQMPIAATTTVRLATLPEAWIRVTSGDRAAVAAPATACGVVAATGEPAAVRRWLDEHGVAAWARYPLGCLMLFCDRFGWRPREGLAIEIDSDVPVSMGVSSSAALEVATLRALERLSGHAFTGTALARLAQRSENELVGAPCGLMDQLAAAYGTAGALLPILCRPDVLSAPLPLLISTGAAATPPRKTCSGVDASTFAVEKKTVSTLPATSTTAGAGAPAGGGAFTETVRVRGAATAMGGESALSEGASRGLVTRTK